MRGADIPQEELFSYRTLEERIPKDYPLWKLRAVVDLLLTTLDSEFDALYARTGRNRFRRSGGCEPVSSKSCSPSAPTRSWSSRSTLISCTAGLSG
jgi:hypothetical protein